jgi:hypothetical protein
VKNAIYLYPSYAPLSMASTRTIVNLQGCPRVTIYSLK